MECCDADGYEYGKEGCDMEWYDEDVYGKDGCDMEWYDGVGCVILPNSSSSPSRDSDSRPPPELMSVRSKYERTTALPGFAWFICRVAGDIDEDKDDEDDDEDDAIEETTLPRLSG